EAGKNLLRVHARLEDLKRHLTADRLGLLGHVDYAEAAFADLFKQLVRTDNGARGFRRRLIDRGGDANKRGRPPGTGLPLVAAQQVLNALAEVGISPASLAEVFCPRARRTNLPGNIEDRLFIQYVAGHDPPALPR